MFMIMFTYIAFFIYKNISDFFLKSLIVGKKKVIDEV